MAGAYCTFCGRRCFVDRIVPDGPSQGWSGHMATCPAGMAHDRAVTGYDHTTAINPLDNSPRWRRHSKSGVNHLVRPPSRVNSECGRAEASPYPRGPQPFVHTWDEPSDNPLMRCTSCVALEAASMTTGGT
jgi:hypothetical protein